jgi:hypothetical protein
MGKAEWTMVQPPAAEAWNEFLPTNGTLIWPGHWPGTHFFHQWFKKFDPPPAGASA